MVIKIQTFCELLALQRPTTNCQSYSTNHKRNKMIKCSECIHVITKQINGIFGNKEPWQVASITAVSLMTLMWILEQIKQDESMLNTIHKPYSYILMLVLTTELISLSFTSSCFFFIHLKYKIYEPLRRIIKTSITWRMTVSQKNVQ